MTDPLILAFDTSDAHCAVALIRGDGLLASAQEPMAKGQAERLMGLVEEVLAQADTPLQSLDAVAVGTGPGNFTGIRISISAARGLALGLGVPAIGVTRFEALEYGTSGPALLCVDARRDMVFVQGSRTDTFAQPALAPIAEVMASGLPIIGAHGTPPSLPVAEATARVGLGRWRAGDTGAPPRPLYLRAADAAPARDAPPVIVS
ncbi:tRNA (adenosine(37)-N6)-threonylcarbamoyltransferase complex dimerization subunit type 1 TsaB [Sulfitobacter sp. HNIBRBA3233]|uniref:tRNA (adenosine(37)-N6)-threonylcarbamoyltransferase complex dimerization subunit type 1 TsaB n=1 Tax=Sulfitobacter marinivivus TaxID=3158558 RepID=UPI0032DF3B82